MHVPVLYDQVMFWLQPRPGERYIDGTVGGAGHARGILERSAPDGRLLALDADAEAIERAQQVLAPFEDRVELVHSNFSRLKDVVEQIGFAPVMGILLDLGISSWQLASKERGFSFQLDGPLDMRFDTNQELTADVAVNQMPVDELADLLWRYGEERQARQIARAIVAHRPIRGTAELAQVIRSAVKYHDKINPATRSFQAIRIWVNRELEALREALLQTRDILASGGRLVVISFHSLEDRLVKQFLQMESRDCICPPEAPVCLCGHKATFKILTRKPIRPTEEEVKSNPRSRSARLRVAEKL